MDNINKNDLKIILSIIFDMNSLGYFDYLFDDLDENEFKEVINKIIETDLDKINLFLKYKEGECSIGYLSQELGYGLTDTLEKINKYGMYFELVE